MAQDGNPESARVHQVEDLLPALWMPGERLGVEVLEKSVLHEIKELLQFNYLGLLLHHRLDVEPQEPGVDVGDLLQAEVVEVLDNRPELILPELHRNEPKPGKIYQNLRIEAQELFSFFVLVYEFPKEVVPHVRLAFECRPDEVDTVVSCRFLVEAHHESTNGVDFQGAHVSDLPN